MSEQVKHECVPGMVPIVFDGEDWWQETGKSEKREFIFCHYCGCRLNPDGTTTERVDKVTGEAVKATWLFRLLDYAAKHNPFDPEKVTHLDVFGEKLPEAYPQYDSEIWSFGDVALVHIHWGDYDEPLIVAIEGLTDDGRTIHAALGGKETD